MNGSNTMPDILSAAVRTTTEAVRGAAGAGLGGKERGVN